MNRRPLRERVLPKSVSGGPVRQRAKKIYGKWWRPERPKKKHAYELVDIFLEANPHVKFSGLIDLALLTLFSHVDVRSKELFEAEINKLNIVFPWNE